MGDSSSFPCKRATNSHDVDINAERPNIKPAPKGGLLQPRHTSYSKNRFWHMQFEKFSIKEAQRFLVLRGHTTLAAGIISRSDLKNLPVYLLRELRNKNWYYNLDLYGNYLEYQRLCIGKKSCRNYGGYQRLAQGLGKDLTHYSFYSCVNQIEFMHLCRHVRSQTGAISKGEESERTISEYFEMLKPKLNDDHLQYIKAKIHMAMDLGILSEIDLRRYPEGIQFLTEASTRKEGDTDVPCSCLGCI